MELPASLESRSATDAWYAAMDDKTSESLDLDSFDPFAAPTSGKASEIPPGPIRASVRNQAMPSKARSMPPAVEACVSGSQSQSPPISAAARPKVCLGRFKVDSLVYSDPVYSTWAHEFARLQEALIQARGPFKRELRMASIFSGIMSEKKVYDLMGTPCCWAFACEKKATAIPSFMDKYQEHHSALPKHFFVDAFDFLAGDTGKRLFHELDPCALPGSAAAQDDMADDQDILHVSTSCRPFTPARSGRREGTTQHPDSSCIDSFMAMLTKGRGPRACVFEQVAGFAQAESKADSVSPLQRLLARIRVEAPAYKAMLFFADGESWLCMRRHGCYLVLIREDCGGTRSLKLLRRIVSVLYKAAIQGVRV